MSTLPSETDVLVVGAGPVGLSTAAVLSARGVDHVLVERATVGAGTSRAAVVHARTLEVLERIGATPAMVAEGVVVPTFTIRDRDRTLVRLDFGGLPTRYPYTLMLPQNMTEAILHDRLSALGGTVHTGREVRRLEIVDGRAVAELVGPDGARSTIDARYVVAADGMHSGVREQSGIAFTGSAYAQSFVLADIHLDWDLPGDEVQMFFSPNGFLVVAPLPHGHHRVVATVDDAPEHITAADVTRLIETRGPTGGSAVRDVVWGSRFRVHHRLADAFRRGPVFLAGDAAHVHSPAGGQGMNTGIQDAIALGGLLGDVLADGADPAVLDRYEAIRRPVARQVVTLTDRMTRAATLSGPATTVRNLAMRGIGSLPPVRRAMAMNLSELALATAP
ncbi:FAD-dependent oxidoreductase [Pseudonocardia sp. GCM10023141]|uniref:FAD-dependent oxidoreductase n=1 Tax=Pseudonocardia sp. GCM10023141 TaxID=3252653 RepID=UPI0036205DFE